MIKHIKLREFSYDPGFQHQFFRVLKNMQLKCCNIQGVSSLLRMRPMEKAMLNTHKLYEPCHSKPLYNSQ